MKIDNKDRMILWTLANMEEPAVDRDRLLDAIVKRGQEYAVDPINWRAMSLFVLGDKLRNFHRDGMLSKTEGETTHWYFSNRNQRDLWRAPPVQLCKTKERRRVILDAEAAKGVLDELSTALEEFDRAYEALKRIRKSTKNLRGALA